MLTVDYERLGIVGGQTLLDIGCGAGRHSFEALRRGARVVAADLDDVVLKDVAQMGAAMVAEGQTGQGGSLRAVRSDARILPFETGSFDTVIASEVMEHIPDDETALREIARVLRPTGRVAVSVPRRGPERICWALSDEYHAAAGGHVRIYDRAELEGRMSRAGLRVVGHHYAHALHSPYWWLKCALGVNERHRLTDAYHALLVWDITRKPRVLRAIERILDPLMGKSLVIYAIKDA
ncbi:MAG TPA: class I SAM-dependent methyltransferase [Actinomycetota bacterium]|nr:class I SAM-dependent methyltransferase [Actinomycetota bacterium]